MAKVIETKLDALVPDNRNFNKGTEFGGHLIEKSLREFGIGRGIVVDKNNRIIAGNKTTENCADIGLDKVIIVETTGDTLVVTKRTDIDIDSPKGREMALADNATGAANLEWDKPVMMETAELLDIELSDWGIHFAETENKEDDEPKEKKISNNILIECKSSGEQERLFYELQSRGFKVSLK